MASKTFQWNPGELDRLQLSIASDGTGDALCECCGRWISAHDPEIEFCSPSLRRYKGARRLVGVDLMMVIAEQRLQFVVHHHKYPRSTALHVSMYGWVLRLQPNPNVLLRRNDQIAAPVRLQVAA